ncbi:MAG: hypothetical protein LBN36_09330 [Clostridiales Family XIII bacterium]|nr:hypothetical protein [Clostridiales Family XIII bacterium]
MNLFYDILMRFGTDIGLAPEMQRILPATLLVLSLLSCFGGYKIFRVWAAFLAFFLTAIFITEHLEGVTNIGTIAITFALVGIVVAFMAFHWIKVSAFVFIILLLFAVTEDFSISKPWLRAILIILPAVLSLPVYGHALIIATSLWGGLTLSALVTANLPLPEQAAFYIGMLLAVMGAFAQYDTKNRRISLTATQLPLITTWRRT